MQPMSLEAVRELVRQNRFGILALARGGDAYALPLFYAYDGTALYFHTLPGTKSEYIAATHEACFTVTIVRTVDDWASAQVFGRIQRVDGTPNELAGMNALMVVPLPPEFGLSPFGEPIRAKPGAIFRLDITRISGRFSQRLPEARPDDVATRGM